MTTKIRRQLALTLLLLVPLGIGTKFYAGPAGRWIHGHVGGVLYVIFWTVAVLMLAPTLSSWTAAGGVLFVTCGLEFLQLWHPPVLQAVRETFIGHTLIGGTFGWWDLLHYGVGAVLGALLVREIKQPPPTSNPKSA